MPSIRLVLSLIIGSLLPMLCGDQGHSPFQNFYKAFFFRGREMGVRETCILLDSILEMRPVHNLQCWHLLQCERLLRYSLKIKRHCHVLEDMRYCRC